MKPVDWTPSDKGEGNKILLTRSDLSKSCQNVPTAAVSLAMMKRGKQEAIEKAGIIAFADTKTGETRLLKNKWGHVAKRNASKYD